MTSLIFGSIYMAHKGVIEHRHEKQRKKNYQRWEDLREEYDAQKKITRESRSLDIPRGDAPYDYTQEHGPRDILTLRDQQEANDARIGWRPQERWEHSHRTHSQPVIPQTAPQHAAPVHAQRTISQPSAYWSSRGELKPQKTGMTWDDGLPAPLRVSRRSYDDYDHKTYRDSARSSSAQVVPVSQDSRRASAVSSQVPSRASSRSPEMESYFSPTPPLSQKLATFSIEPVESHVPGGRMAELIERGY